MVRTRRHQPTEQQRSQATLLSSYGIPQEQIATMLRLDAKTLRKHYRRELDVGMTEANTEVAKSLFHMATKGQVPSAAIFWMKARAGWRQQQDVNIGGTDRPVGIDFTWAPARPPVLTKVPTIDSEGEAEGEDAGDVVVSWQSEKSE
jgi:hypothetical protein